MRHATISLGFFAILLAGSVNAYSQPDIQSDRYPGQYGNLKYTGQSMIILNNSDQSIPLKSLADRKIASINTGSLYATAFDSLLSKYAPITRFELFPQSTDSLNVRPLRVDIEYYNTLVIQVTGRSLSDPHVVRFIADHQGKKELILVGFGDIAPLQRLKLTVPIIWSADYTEAEASYAAQLIFGGRVAKNMFGNEIGTVDHSEFSNTTTAKTRLTYGLPEDVGISSVNLDRIDPIVAEAIAERATPSAVVMVVKNGVVIFNKAYGSPTYEQKQPARITDIYDLASITKVSATTMSAMKLYDEHKIDLNANLGKYLPETKETNKYDISLRDVLLHQSGLIWIPFHTKLQSTDYRADSSDAYPIKVAEGYFLRRDYYREKMWPALLNTPLRNPRYTDLNMYVMREVIERLSNTPFDQYTMEQFYKPLGMYRAGFNPWKRFAKEEIVPTENDTIFRNVLLRGYVHDQGAAMMGGISGHAGLFASANDLAILYQMMLNRGSYGGERYFKPETVDLFTSKQSFISRRGLGFDRWDPDTSQHYPSRYASTATYGHTGFTGTCVWVDPRHGLIYIFLSNRVHPEVSNKLYDLNTRTRILDVIYEAIQKGI